MALQAKYLALLAAPSNEWLASDASINYVPTVTTISEASAVLKHLKTQQQVVSKKSEKILNAFETSNSLCLETDTTLQFLLGGGTYLPGLDDNFLADKVVNVPIIHIVTFDADQKISRIRLHWDQACLLKAVDTIGARGRNWPINSGKDQARVITSSTIHGEAISVEDARAGRPLSRGVDPHSSLSLFAPRDSNASARDESAPNLVAPRQSAKPAPREWGELFAGEETTVGSNERSPSPSKLDNHLKSGAGKHYRDIRVFDPEADTTKNRGIKTYSSKYEHFEFGEAEFTPKPVKTDRTKHMSQWDFSDFTTPHKQKERATASHIRNFDISEHTGEAQAEQPPVWSEHIPQPRGDSTAHFDIGDATPKEEKPRAFIARTAQSKGLYHDPVFGSESDEGEGDGQKKPLGNVTNTKINNAAREAAFGSHWETTDQPSSASNENGSQQRSGKNVSEATKKVVKGMESAWEMSDPSPQRPQGIKILGTGTGSSKAAEPRWWEY